MKKSIPLSASAEPAVPSAYECCLLLLHLWDGWARERESVPTRFRLSEATLKNVFCRPRLDPAFLTEVQDWLLRSGWVLFFAGGSYGMIKTEVVESWARVGSKRIKVDLKAVSIGEFDFMPLRKLVTTTSADQDD
jgi:hypothetical protein